MIGQFGFPEIFRACVILAVDIAVLSAEKINKFFVYCRISALITPRSLFNVNYKAILRRAFAERKRLANAVYAYQSADVAKLFIMFKTLLYNNLLVKLSVVVNADIFFAPAFIQLEAVGNIRGVYRLKAVIILGEAVEMISFCVKFLSFQLRKLFRRVNIVVKITHRLGMKIRKTGFYFLCFFRICKNFRLQSVFSAIFVNKLNGSLSASASRRV